METNKIQELMNEVEIYKQAIQDAKDALASAEMELDERLDEEYRKEPHNDDRRIITMENKVKVYIMGCAAVIVSSVALEDWKLAEKYAPERLKIADEDGNTVFAVKTESGPGHCVREEVGWGESVEEGGKACITLVIDPKIDDKRKVFTDLCGSALLDLMDIEKEMPDLLKEIREKQEQVEGCIVVLE